MASAPYAAGGEIPYNPYAYPQQNYGAQPIAYPSSDGSNVVSTPAAYYDPAASPSMTTPYDPAASPPMAIPYDPAASAPMTAHYDPAALPPMASPYNPALVPATAPQSPYYGPVPAPAIPMGPQMQDLSGVGVTRPLHVRKETSLTFTNVAAANDWSSNGSPTITAYSNNAPSSRRVIKGRRSTDNRSTYSTSSGVTSIADVQTRYVNMLLALDHIHWMYDVLASAFCWLLLAGFIVMPQTLTKTIPDIIDKVGITDDELKNALKVVSNHVGLFYIAGGVSGFGLLGMLCLWWHWRGNYIWIMQKIFMPGCFNALAGSISTLISIFLLNKGKWDVLSIVTIGVVGGVTVANGLLTAICLFLLYRLRKKHKKIVGKHSAGKAGGGRYRGFVV